MLYETILTRENADRHRASGWWPDRLLNDSLAVAVARYPGRTALVDSRGRMTYATLQAQLEQCALGLFALGIRHGDVVAAQLPNWNEFVVLTLALERIGAIINPISPIFRHRELRVMLRLAGSVAAVIPATFRDWDYPAMYAELKGDAPELKHVVVINGDAGGRDDGILSWSECLPTGLRGQLAARCSTGSVRAQTILRNSSSRRAQLASRKVSCTPRTLSVPSLRR